MKRVLLKTFDKKQPLNGSMYIVQFGKQNQKAPKQTYEAALVALSASPFERCPHVDSVSDRIPSLKTTMDEEGLEEWDAEFLDQVIQVQERVISDSQKQREPPSSHANPITYSPPRHLSQRSNAVSSSSALPPRVRSSQLEIGRLKVRDSFLFCCC